MLISDVLANALIELGVLAAGEAPTPEDSALMLSKLNRLFGRWNAERRTVYASQFNSYTLTPSLTPHTIGPTGTFVVTQRPVSLEDAGLVLTSTTPNVRVPITIRDAEWWANQVVKALSSDIPTDLYYEPDWPNGKLFFWPVPSTAYQVELQTRLLLATVALADTFTMPPGYEDAITFSLAEDAIGLSAVDAETAATVRANAVRARAIVFANNSGSRRQTTADAGLPSSGSGKTYNYLLRTM